MASTPCYRLWHCVDLRLCHVAVERRATRRDLCLRRTAAAPAADHLSPEPVLCALGTHDFGYQFGYRMFKPGAPYPDMEQTVLYGGTDPDALCRLT